MVGYLFPLWNHGNEPRHEGWAMNKKDLKLIAKAYELSSELWDYATYNQLESLKEIATHQHKVINRLEDELRKDTSHAKV
jgi:hypothetical protein